MHFVPTGSRSRLRLGVRPATAVAGRRTLLRFRATRGHGAVVAGAVIRIAGRWVRTDASGSARMRVRFATPGRRRATATRADLRPGRAVVRVSRG